MQLDEARVWAVGETHGRDAEVTSSHGLVVAIWLLGALSPLHSTRMSLPMQLGACALHVVGGAVSQGPQTTNTTRHAMARKETHTALHVQETTLLSTHLPLLGLYRAYPALYIGLMHIPLTHTRTRTHCLCDNYLRATKDHHDMIITRSRVLRQACWEWMVGSCCACMQCRGLCTCSARAAKAVRRGRAAIVCVCVCVCR